MPRSTELAAERYCISFSRVYEKFESVVVRYFNVFGPRQSPFSQYAAVIPLFITAIANSRPVTIEGDGEQRRDFTYVENVVDGTLRAGDTAGVSGRIFNLAASAPASVNELAELIGTIVGRQVERTSAPSRAGDIRDSWADISTAREILGYEPSVGLEEGLRRTVERSNAPTGQMIDRQFAGADRACTGAPPPPAQPGLPPLGACPPRDHANHPII